MSYLLQSKDKIALNDMSSHKKSIVDVEDEDEEEEEECKIPKKKLKIEKQMKQKEKIEEVEDEGEEESVSCAIGKDPFCDHFERNISDSLSERLLKLSDQEAWSKCEVILLPDSVGKADLFWPTNSNQPSINFNERDLRSIHVKKSLCDQLSADKKSELTDFQLTLFSIMNSYQDLYFPKRTHENGEEIRTAYCLHALNHVLKTRNRIISHNSKITNKSDEIPEEFRDQGLTRPKVLMVLPFRDSALKVVNTMAKLLSKEQCYVAKKRQFEQQFGSDDDSSYKKGLKPVDFEAVFTGNTDDHFSIGIGLAKKTLKLYTDFYSSDIIIASPLGLWTIIGAADENERDFDFLSSIEVLIFDQMDVFFMQNFEHISHLITHLHRVPKESHDVDYFRIRLWTLNGWSKLYRQTLIFSSFTHPQINQLFRRDCFNFSGKVKVQNLPESGSVLDVCVVPSLHQVFHRIEANSISETPDLRFNYFVKQILPHYCDGSMPFQTLIFLSSYFDFVRLRNHFIKEGKKTASNPNFEQLNEYSKKKEISRARQFFLEGKVQFLLLTERFHFYRRYKIRGIQHLIFYDFPLYSHFYPEICNMMFDTKRSAFEAYNQQCTVLFTKYDLTSLVPVLGRSKAYELVLSEKNINTFLSER